MEENKEELKVNLGLLVFLFLIFVAFAAVMVGFGSKGASQIQSSPTPEDKLKLNLGGQQESAPQAPQNQIANQNQPMVEFKAEDIKIGEGKEAQAGKKLTVNYVGTLLDGTKFDSSYDRGQPFTFTLGAGRVIEGWEKGLLGMKVGGKRRLVIPPEMGYGDRQVGNIPPNSALIFEVELLSVE